MDWKLTDLMTFHRGIDKLRVAKTPEAGNKVFISIGPGGKGSEYVSISAEDALDLARFLTVEAHRAIENKEAKSSKRGAK
jgi:hypothetical protein